MDARPSFVLALRVFIPYALGYYLSYVFRTINAVIAPDLVTDINLSAAGLGLLTSAYFLSFAACQLPLGVMLDRIGPKKTEAVLLLLAAVGSAWFAIAETETELICARALIGMGVSACLMASLRLRGLVSQGEASGHEWAYSDGRGAWGHEFYRPD